MRIKIWERYFLKQFTQMFFLFLGCFYGLYVLIDYASQSGMHAHHGTSIGLQETARYYLFVFANQAEILIPLALLVAFVSTVCNLNTHHELVAFMAGGFSLKTLMRPFIACSLLAVLILYANEQFLLPSALRQLKKIENLTKHQRKHPESFLAVKHVILKDGSLLIYQNYDILKKRFFDVYWIPSVHNIYRMKYLYPEEGMEAKGYFVDHLVRQANGELLQQEAYRELSLPDIKFSQNLLQSTIIDPEILSLSTLATQFLNIPSHPNEKEAQVLTAFYWKMIIPWLCLLSILAPAPFCLKYSRALPVFLITVASLFGLIAFYMFLDAGQVVAKRQVASPFLVICGPFLMAFSVVCFRFFRLS